jgi:hypothetical protein
MDEFFFCGRISRKGDWLHTLFVGVRENLETRGKVLRVEVKTIVGVSE